MIVSARQRGNPVLEAVRNVGWAFGETVADYVLSESAAALFLSLRYHLLHPAYLMRRMREMAHHFTLRLVLLLVDSDEAEKPLVELTRQTLSQDFTLVCAWSVAEAARYLETFKAYARKPADLIKERSDGAFSTQLADVLTTVRPLNKTDASTLHGRFGSLHRLLRASHEELALCPGLGERKVRRLREAAHEPFVPSRARAVVGAAAAAAAAAPAVAPAAEAEADGGEG
jgi:DNA excision repair protein ERCC-1